MNDKIRLCVGCKQYIERNKMFRLLKKHDSGEIIISPTNKDFGRSVYICKNKECIAKAFKNGKTPRIISKSTAETIKLKLEKALTI